MKHSTYFKKTSIFLLIALSIMNKCFSQSEVYHEILAMDNKKATIGGILLGVAFLEYLVIPTGKPQIIKKKNLRNYKNPMVVNGIITLKNYSSESIFQIGRYSEIYDSIKYQFGNVNEAVMKSDGLSYYDLKELISHDNRSNLKTGLCLFTGGLGLIFLGTSIHLESVDYAYGTDEKPMVTIARVIGYVFGGLSIVLGTGLIMENNHTTVESYERNWKKKKIEIAMKIYPTILQSNLKDIHFKKQIIHSPGLTLNLTF